MQINKGEDWARKYVDSLHFPNGRDWLNRDLRESQEIYPTPESNVPSTGAGRIFTIVRKCAFIMDSLKDVWSVRCALGKDTEE